MTQDVPWRDSHRMRLHRFASNDSDEQVQVLAPDLDSSHLGMRTEKMSTSKMSAFYFDMKLAGGPLQCSEDDGTCEDIRCVDALEQVD